MEKTSHSVDIRLGRRFTRIYALVVVISAIAIAAFFTVFNVQQQKQTDKSILLLLQSTLVEHLQYFEFAATPATLDKFNSVLEKDRIAVLDRYNMTRGATGMDSDNREASTNIKLLNQDGYYVGALEIWEPRVSFLRYEFHWMMLIPTVLIIIMLEIARRAVNRVAKEEVLQPLSHLKQFVEARENANNAPSRLARHPEFFAIEHAFQDAYSKLSKGIKQREIEMLRRREQAETIRRVLTAADIVISHYSADKSRRESNIGAVGNDSIRAVMNLPDFDCERVCEAFKKHGASAKVITRSKDVEIAPYDEAAEPIYRLDVEEPGGSHWICTSLPMSDGGRAFIAKNETELHRAEMHLRQSQKMDALGVLTSGVAHDFNNILAILIGALDEISFQNIEKDKEFLLIAQDATERAIRVVRQLLDYASTDNEKIGAVDQNQILSKMDSFLPATIGPKWKTVLDIQAAPWVLCDPNLFEAAILNLIVNARDASPDGGKIIISSQMATHRDLLRLETRTRPESSQSFIKISVSDEGTGINNSVAAKVFDPFFTTKGRGCGTGLGLAMVYGMVKRAGGTVYFSRNSPKGTCVSILLPVAPQNQIKAATTPRILDGALCNLKAIVVEDEALLMRVLLKKLESAGVQATPCDTLEDVVSVLKTTNDPFDFILSDVQMPDHDGYEVAKCVNRLAPKTSMVLMSGNLEMNIISNLGFTVGVIEKPFNLDQLARVIRNLAETKSNTSQFRSH